MGSEPRTPVFGVDMDRHRKARRWIRHVFHGASLELEALVMNFVRYGELAIPMTAGFYSGKCVGYWKVKGALTLLMNGGYVKMARNYWHEPSGRGSARLYRRTALFESTFRFRVPDQLAVKKEVLCMANVSEIKGLCHLSHINIEGSAYSITALSAYCSLLKGVKLSLSNGGQVFEGVDLWRDDGKYRLYARGEYNYLNGIIKEWRRRYLLINGEPVIELDYTAMHANLLINREGLPSDSMLYERLLVALGVEPAPAERRALKQIVNTSFNNESLKGFSAAVYGMVDDDGGERLIDILGVKPKQVYYAILDACPALAPYVCASKQLWKWLQHEESEIMIGVLERLAESGVVGLPVHDSVIVPIQHKVLAERVMVDCYRRRTGFEISVK
jgi:hypothetical protein